MLRADCIQNLWETACRVCISTILGDADGLVCPNGHTVPPSAGYLITPSNQGSAPGLASTSSRYLHSGNAPWARAERTSMSLRRSRGIHAARPTPRRLRSACTQVAFCGVWAAAVWRSKARAHFALSRLIVPTLRVVTHSITLCVMPRPSSLPQEVEAASDDAKEPGSHRQHVRGMRALALFRLRLFRVLELEYADDFRSMPGGRGDAV
jgi:hypothetical protein